MSAVNTQVLCPHCGSSVNNIEFHFGLHEECGEMDSKRGTGLVDKMSAGAAESVRVAVSQSERELLKSSDENRRKKTKKSKQFRKEEKADAKTYSGSFADYLQESKEERDQRKLNERSKKAAALEAKKKAELDSALSFIDGQLKSGSDLSDDEEENKEEESMFQWIPNYKSERRETCEDWTTRLTWGEIRGQVQSPQKSEFLQAPSAVSSTRTEEVSEDIPGGKVHSKVKMEEDFEDRESRVTQDMCSTSVSTDSKPQVMKMERPQDVRKEKLRLFVQSGNKKFQVSLAGNKKVKKVREAVAGQLQVQTYRVELQVDGGQLHDSSLVSNLNLCGSSIIATVV